MVAIFQMTCSNAFSCVKIYITISMKFVPKGPVNNIPALVQIMTWRRPGDKSLSEPMMVKQQQQKLCHTEIYNVIHPGSATSIILVNKNTVLIS